VSVEVVIRISDSSEGRPEQWADVRAVLPSDWSIQEKATHRAASKDAEAMDSQARAIVLLTGHADAECEGLIERTMRALIRRRPFIEQLLRKPVVECYVIVQGDDVNVELDPDLQWLIVNAGADLIAVRES
jgi:hypothetical protein